MLNIPEIRDIIKCLKSCLQIMIAGILPPLPPLNCCSVDSDMNFCPERIASKIPSNNHVNASGRLSALRQNSERNCSSTPVVLVCATSGAAHKRVQKQSLKHEWYVSFANGFLLSYADPVKHGIQGITAYHPPSPYNQERAPKRKPNSVVQLC